MSKIKFGTDGWRAIMCEDFIISNVEIVVQGVCNYLIEAGKADRGLIIGYDTRFFSDRFAQRAAMVCNANGIKVLMSEKDCPTPVTAFSILAKETAGALMFTASHNPPEYNGIKFIPENAAPALPQVTDKIESHVKAVAANNKIKILSEEEFEEKKMTQTFDPSAPYIKAINNIVDLTAISKSGLKVIYDALYATGRNYVPKVLQPVTDFTMIHGNTDPYFGGSMPEPKKEILTELKDLVLKEGAHLGLANDGDADRFGVIDSNGEFINPNQVLSLVYLHLLKNRGLKGSAARTVATTHLIDAIAARYQCNVVETPVGFKYIGNELYKENVIIGGEESGGLSIMGHIPEKDGVLAVALMAEIIAIEGKTLSQLLKEMYKEFGTFYSRRVDIHTTDEHKNKFFSKTAIDLPDSIGGMKVVRHSEIDGFKLYLEDDSWVLFRPSGTEPLVRIYMEAHSNERLDLLAKEATNIFMSLKTAAVM